MTGEVRVVLVTGKGGVGKTTVVASLGMAGARRGMRVLLAETAGARQLPPIFGVESQGYAPVELWRDSEGGVVEGLTITPRESIEEYLLLRLRFRALYRVAFQNRVMEPFMAAVPGLHDLMHLGKIWYEEAQVLPNGRPGWDLVIVDLPATGHGLAMLQSPRSMMELTKAGPFHDNAAKVEELFGDPKRCALVLVSRPEAFSVNETIQLHARLDRYRDHVQAVIINQVRTAPVADAEDWERAKTQLSAPWLAEAVELTDRAMQRAARQVEAEERLAEGVGMAPLSLPYLPRFQLGTQELRALSEPLGTLL